MFRKGGYSMAKSEPLRTHEDIQKIKDFYLKQNNVRNYTLFTLGINTALRISDILALTWTDVYDFETEAFRNHIIILEQKTKKVNMILLNENSCEALALLKISLENVMPSNFIFQSARIPTRPIHRSRAYSIIKNAAKACQIEGIICCHSMRKTFGYHAWKEGVPPALIMEIYNHSSIETTKRYLSIIQDDKDLVFKRNLL